MPHLSAGKPELKSVEVIVADVAEPESLAIMCKQGVIVLNCVGPVSPQRLLSKAQEGGIYTWVRSHLSRGTNVAVMALGKKLT